MTIREIINQLQNLGYNVEFRERFEKLSKGDVRKKLKKNPSFDASKVYARGIRITAIDGIKFTGSTGNIKARELLGEQLSERRTSQLERIRRPRVEPLPTNIAKELRRLQRLANKLRKKLTPEERLDPKKSIPKITTKNIRYTIKNYGVKEAFTQLTNYERKIKRLVPIWLWDELVAKINLDSVFIMDEVNKQQNEVVANNWNEFVELINNANVDNIRYYEDYQPLIEALYDLEKEMPFLEEVNAILEGIMLPIARRL